MKASIAWLKSLCPTDLSIEDIASRLTMAGLEVETLESASKTFSNIVVGEILRVTPHPESNKLNICEVADGNSVHQVVCGAPNVKVGLKVPFAQVGSVIGDGFEISRVKIRGVESSGMLCGADELGLSDERHGLMELPIETVIGTNFEMHVALPDQIIELDLTPNRGDCLSIRGLARELGVLSDTILNIVSCIPALAESETTYPVTLSEPKGCPRYIGRVIEEIDVNQQTPLWMVERLRRSGIRSIDSIVDITNYVMIELGQPLHAFDCDQLTGAIDVRMSRTGETIVLLDGKTLCLTDDVLVVADQEKVLALAGIMGGKDSGISSKTKTIFIESAFFDPVIIAGKARRFGLHTNASARFERGVDFQLAEFACERATSLMVEICGGKPGPVVITEDTSELPEISVVELTRERIQQQLKIVLSDERIYSILKTLGFGVEIADKGFRCVVPSWRFDVSIEQDLVEEIARIYGYNNLPTTLPAQVLNMAKVAESETPLIRLKHYLVDQDIQEVITYSFVDPKIQSLFSDSSEGICLTNPIASNLAEMRQSLIPGLVEAVRYNVNRQATRVRLFETGQCFIKHGKSIDQSERIGIALYGLSRPLHFNDDKSVDFFDIKGIIEGFSQLNGGSAFDWKAADHPALAPGQTASLSMHGQVQGYVGKLHPRLARKFDLPKSLLLADFTLNSILVGQVTAFKAISRYPKVVRDLSVFVDEEIAWQQIVDSIRSLSDDRIQAIELFDVYRGAGVRPGQQSMALSLTLQDPLKTLDDSAIQELVDQAVCVLSDQVGAELRG